MLASLVSLQQGNVNKSKKINEKKLILKELRNLLNELRNFNEIFRCGL